MKKLLYTGMNPRKPPWRLACNLSWVKSEDPSAKAACYHRFNLLIYVHHVQLFTFIYIYIHLLRIAALLSLYYSMWSCLFSMFLHIIMYRCTCCMYYHIYVYIHSPEPGPTFLAQDLLSRPKLCVARCLGQSFREATEGRGQFLLVPLGSCCCSWCWWWMVVFCFWHRWYVGTGQAVKLFRKKLRPKNLCGHPNKLIPDSFEWKYPCCQLGVNIYRLPTSQELQIPFINLAEHSWSEACGSREAVNRDHQRISGSVGSRFRGSLRSRLWTCLTWELAAGWLQSDREDMLQSWFLDGCSHNYLEKSCYNIRRQITLLLVSIQQWAVTCSAGQFDRWYLTMASISYYHIYTYCIYDWWRCYLELVVSPAFYPNSCQSRSTGHRAIYCRCFLISGMSIYGVPINLLDSGMKIKDSASFGQPISYGHIPCHGWLVDMLSNSSTLFHDP